SKNLKNHAIPKVNVVLSFFVIQISDVDRIQTGNLLSRNQMRYSVAPRGLFAGANIRLILKFRKCFPYFFPFLFLCQISGESSKITLSDYYCFSKVIYTVGYSGIEGY